MFDSLTVYDSDYDLVGQFCGNLPQNKVLFTSKKKNLLLHFHTDRSGHNMGFKIRLHFQSLLTDEDAESTDEELGMQTRKCNKLSNYRQNILSITT